MSPEEGIRPAGPAAQEAAVRYTSCPMVQAIICLRAAGPLLRMFRQYHCRRWNIWGSVRTAEENNMAAEKNNIVAEKKIWLHRKIV